MKAKAFIISSVTNNGRDMSVFSSRKIAVQGDQMRMLSAQQDCVNFRLRASENTFSSDFHVAGDPTLLVVLSGAIRISLRNGDYQDFSAGQMFIAEDYLEPELSFDSKVHGHSAIALGDEPLHVLHLKLAQRS